MTTPRAAPTEAPAAVDPRPDTAPIAPESIPTITAPPAGPIIVACGPSADEGTVLKRCCDDFPDDLAFAISVTTRAPRAGEKDGVHYHFKSKEEVQRMVSAGELLQHSERCGDVYGVQRAAVEAHTASGRACFVDVDVSGAEQLKAARLGALFVFVAPPSLEALEARLRQRGGETEASVRRRLHFARREIERKDALGLFGTTIVNDGDGAAVATLRAAVASVRSLRLSTALLKKSLGKLGPTAGGVAFRRLAVQGMDLTDCELVRGYPALQTADLSRNRLECLAPLGSLPQLSTLIAGENSLRGSALTALPPSLTSLSAAHNRISSMSGVARLPHLKALDLAGNNLSAVTTSRGGVPVAELAGLRFLRELDLSRNALAADAPLPLPPSLSRLRLEHNALSTLRQLPRLPRLKHLDVSHNALAELRGVEAAAGLVELVAASNKLAGLEAVAPLAKLTLLSTADLRGNPLAAQDAYRLDLVHALLPGGVNLGELDGEAVSAEEKVRALNRHGASDALLAEIRERFLPTKSSRKARAERENAAKQVQTLLRGKQARDTVGGLNERRSSAATALQSKIRGNRDRSAIDDLHVAPASVPVDTMGDAVKPKRKSLDQMFS